MRESVYTDSEGFQFLVLVPENEDDLSKGMFLGPPELDELGYDKAVLKNLNSDLVQAGLYQASDLIGQRVKIRKIIQGLFPELPISESRNLERMIIHLFQSE